MEHCDEVSVVRNNKISHIHVMYIPVYIYIFFLSRAWISVALQRHVKSGGNERLGVPSPTFLFVRSCALELWRHGESTLGAYARLIYSSLYMYDQHYPHSYYGSHTNKIAYSDLVYRSRFLNTNTLFTSTVCQFFAIQGFISLCWKMTFLGNWKKFTDNLMKLGKFYYLAYIKNTGLIHILNTSYVSPFPHFGNNYKGFSVNAFPIHTMIWHPAVFHWHSTVRSVGSMISVTLLISA